jgi:hypothetical protein
MVMRQLVMHRLALRVVTTDRHLSAADIAAFIDRSLPLEERADAEIHLSGCDRCREELASCARLTSSAPATPERRATWRLAGLAAAAVIIAVVLRPSALRNDHGAALERASINAGSRMTTVSPTADRVVARTELRFVWRRDDRSSGYRVIVTDSIGAPVWTEDVVDTSAAPPVSARLIPGTRYFWRVEALHADGSATQSDETPFRVRPE